jgi:hypothetical protein
VNTRSSAKLSGDFFGDFRQSAWRLEWLPEYDDADTRERVAQFLRGHVPPQSPWYLNGVRQALAQGKTMRRVHVIGELTDYLRYELAMYQQSASAGEDVPILDADKAARLDLPPFDFWLLDRGLVIRMDYGPRGAFTGRELITDTGTVARCCRASGDAMRAAPPLHAYMSMIRDGPFREAAGSETVNCVEVAGLPEGGILVRDSKDSSGPVLAFADGAWELFLAGVRTGCFEPA